jgi:sRNA-binding protein
MANPSWSKAKYAARGVHLDQDTAGRLLESMGDHARREMIVRVAKVARQNPAYRPFANNGATSDNVPSEVARFSERRAATKSKDDAPKNW